MTDEVRPILSQSIPFGAPVRVNPQVIRDDDWGRSPHTLTIVRDGRVELVRGDDGLLYLFVGLQPLFGLGDRVVNTRDDVSFIDEASVSVMPLSNLAPTSRQFVPLTPNNLVGYTFQTGITIGGGISVKGSYSKKEGGKGEVGADFKASWTSSQTSSFSTADIAILAELQGEGMTWRSVMQNVYDGAEAKPYNRADPHQSIHKQPGNHYIQPAPAASGTVQLGCQAVWQLPAGSSGVVTLGTVTQARLIQGHAFRGWGQTSYTWVSTRGMIIEIDLDRGTMQCEEPGVFFDQRRVRLWQKLAGALQPDGAHARIDD